MDESSVSLSYGIRIPRVECIKMNEKKDIQKKKKIVYKSN